MSGAMKRAAAFAFALIVLCCAFGAQAEEAQLRGYDAKNGYVYLNMGVYPQDADGGLRPILWRVLSVEDGQAYLCSEYVLFAHPVHHDDKEYAKAGGDFRITDLWALLNGEFLEESFTEEERSFLITTEELGTITLLDSNDLKNSVYGLGGKDTKDKKRRGWGTEYAKANGLFVYSRSYGSHSPYWLRNQSSTADYACRCTKESSQIGWIRVVVANEGVRPVCYLDTSLIQIVGGKGTQASPYQIAPFTLTLE